MFSSTTCHISIIMETYLQLGYYIVLLLLFSVHQSYKQTHFFHPDCKNATLDAINLLANNIKWNVNEVTLYEMKLKSMKRKILYYPLNEKMS